MSEPRTDESTVRKILLLVPTLVLLIPGAVGLYRQSPWLLVLLSVPLLAIAGAVFFFFPDQTVGRIARAYLGRKALREGVIDEAHMRRFLTKSLRRPPSDAFVHDLGRWYATRAAASRDDIPRLGAVIVAWLRARQDPVLLRDALAAGLSPLELEGHLDGSMSLNPSTVAALAALAAGPRHDPSLKP